MTIIVDRLTLSLIDVSVHFKGAISSTFSRRVGPRIRSGDSSRLYRIVAGSLITMLIVFFFFRDGKVWLNTLVEATPLTPVQSHRLLSNISDTIVANVYGILSVGLAQGTLTGIAITIVGIPSPLLLGLGAAFASIIPVVGAAIVWVPCGLYLIFTGALWKGVFVLLWGVLVISAADNIIRPWVVSGKVELHPLILLFFILGGVEAFGFIGLFIGPVVASVLAVLYTMFREELPSEKNSESTST